MLRLSNNTTPFDKLIVYRQLTWSCIFENNKHLGVVLPNYESVKKFKNELMRVMGEVPNWLLNLKCANTRRIESVNGVSVLLFNSADSIRGVTLDVVYVADDLSRKQQDAFMYCVIPTLRGGSITMFQNVGE